MFFFLTVIYILFSRLFSDFEICFEMFQIRHFVFENRKLADKGIILLIIPG